MQPQVLLAGGSRVAAALPRRWADAMAQMAGDLAAQCMPAARRAVIANLTQALGACPPGAARRVFRSYALYYLGLMRLAHLATPQAVGQVSLHGEARLRRTLARGRGAVLLTGHFGNWDVAGIAIAARFGGLHVYAEPLRPACLWRFYARARARHGVRALPAGAHSRAPFTVLRQNGLLGLLADRPFGVRSARVPFGRGELVVPTGAIRLALRTGAAVHAVFAVRDGGGCTVHVGPELAPSPGMGEESARVREVAALYAATLHGWVRRHPDQWCLLQPADAGGTVAVPPQRATFPQAGAA